MSRPSSEPGDEQSPWPLFILLHVLHISICYPTTNVYIRQGLLGPAMVALSVHLYTKRAYFQGRGSLVYMVGCIIASQLCSMTHLVYAQKGFPDLWRRVKDEAGGDKISLPSKFPLRKKIMWTLDLNYSVREVGWVQEARKFLPPHPNCSRIAFIRSRILHALIYFLTLDLVETHQAGNPAFDTRVHQDSDGPEAYIRGKALFLRVPDLLSWGLRVVSAQSLSYTLIALVSVVVGFSEPADWPNMYGSPQDAYTLRRFWGRVWHQSLRVMVSGIGKFLAHDVCGLKPGTNLSSYIQLYVAFFLSGLIHTSADYMMIGYFPWFSLRFFLLQAMAISFEDLVIRALKPFCAGTYSRMNRILGYLWVISWFYWTGPLWLDPTSASGTHVCDKGVIFGRVWDLRNDHL